MTKEQQIELSKKNWIVVFELSQERDHMKKNPEVYSKKEFYFIDHLIETFTQRAVFYQIPLEKHENNYAIAE